MSCIVAKDAGIGSRSGLWTRWLWIAIVLEVVTLTISPTVGAGLIVPLLVITKMLMAAGGRI